MGGDAGRAPQARTRLARRAVLGAARELFLERGYGATTIGAISEQADVPLQRYAHRSDLPCGSTIGPITAAAMGVSTFDVGAPQLAMHSARELCGAAEPARYAAAMAAFLAPAG